MMLLFCLQTIAYILMTKAANSIEAGPADSWFHGCVGNLDHELLSWVTDGSQLDVAACSNTCMDNGFRWSLVGQTDGRQDLQCSCTNITAAQYLLHNTASCILRSGLPVGEISNGSTPHSWAVYRSDGPFLSSVTIATDVPLVVIDKLVAIEIHITRPTARSVSKDDSNSSHMVMVTWQVSGDIKSYHENISIMGYTEVLIRPRFTFSTVGHYTIVEHYTVDKDQHGRVYRDGDQIPVHILHSGALHSR
ncbi:uncharacterized protein LOC128225574 [Mya arenaria]|uniref:uncharacterized protein LOC128225574 n=1 Tax=Mya arenaria TaxID=6604 RepID=UPI0022DFDECE|nr:uncharacterized protein LOC128225574 [Mya arenaria]